MEKQGRIMRSFVQMPARASRALAWLCFGLPGVLALLLAGCGGVTDEPRIVSTVPPRVAQSSAQVNAAALSAEGAQIFAERCSPCHGEQGQGDGPVVRAGQLTAPPDFTQPATMTVQGEEALYDVITAGRIDKMMPPWADALSEAQRRAVAQFVAALGGSAAAASVPTEVQDGMAAPEDP
jgi:mono/diheme cytochrome c family protein